MRASLVYRGDWVGQRILSLDLVNWTQVAKRIGVLQRNDCDVLDGKETECEAPEMRGSLTCELPHTHSLMELSHSWEHANCAATQELPSILWIPNVHYRVHKSPLLVHILTQINPIHTFPSYLRSILILSTYLRLGLPSGLFPSGFPTNILYAFLLSRIRATFPAHLILLDLIILMILYYTKIPLYKHNNRRSHNKKEYVARKLSKICFLNFQSANYKVNELISKLHTSWFIMIQMPFISWIYHC
jgi:hypothetical protein